MPTIDSAGKALEGQQEEEEEEIILPYQAIAPSIFVPAHTDFTKPPPPLPSDPNTLRSEALAQIDEHAEAVQANIHYMLNREKTRVRRECRFKEASYPRNSKATAGLAEGEDHWLPRNGMELDEIMFIRSNVPMPPRGPYEVPPTFSHAQCLHVPDVDGEPPRKLAEKMVLSLAKHGVENLEALAVVVRNVKEAKSKELENEMLSKKLGSAGVAPADRMDIS